MAEPIVDRRLQRGCDAHATLYASLSAESAPLRFALGGGLVALGGVDRSLRVWSASSSVCDAPLVLGSADLSPLIALESAAHDMRIVVLAAASAQCLQIWTLRREIAGSPTPDSAPSLLCWEDDADLAEASRGKQVHAVGFEPGAQRLVVLLSCEAWIFNVGGSAIALFLRLVGHLAPLVACPLRSLVLSAGMTHPCVALSASEDRCFKLWGLEPLPASYAGLTDSCAVASDKSGSRLLLQSSLPTDGAPLLCAALHPRAAQVVLGDASGRIHVFEVYLGAGARPAHALDLEALGCRCTHRIDVERFARLSTEHTTASGAEAVRQPGAGAILSSAPVWQRPAPSASAPAGSAAAASSPSAAQSSCAVLSLAYVRLPRSAAEEALRGSGGSGVEASEASEFSIVVTVPGPPMMLHVGRWEPMRLPLMGDDASCSEVVSRSFVCDATVSAVARSSETGRKMDGQAASDPTDGGERRLIGWMARTSAFQPYLRLWRLWAGQPLASAAGDGTAARGVAREHATDRVPSDSRDVAAGEAHDGHLSVLPSRPPLRESPLGRALAADLPSAAGGRLPKSLCGGVKPVGGSRPSLGAAGGTAGRKADQPVTFHRKVASSGYGKPPVMKLHAGGPSTAAARAASAATTSGMLGRGSAPLARRYTAAEGPLTHLQAANSGAVAALGSAVTRLAFAPDATRLALAAHDGSVTLLRLPTRRYLAKGAPSPPTLPGHTAALTGVHWSHSGRLLLSASADGSACLWDVSHDRPPAAPLLRMQHSSHSPKLGAALTGAESAANPIFAAEVRDAAFFYLDRFILLASGNGLHLYSYSLQHTPSHDAARAAELRHKYRLQHRWAMPRAQHISSFSASNSFLSPIVLVGGSDRSVVAVDLGTGAPVLTLTDAHERPLHTLRQHEGSAHGPTPAAGHDLFLSSALDGVIKLWDLRSASCVRRFAAHVNKVMPVGASLSPCMRFVCSGSEDRSAFLYDARSGGLIERLRQGPEAVLDCAFSPLYPQLACADAGGHVHFFSDRPEGVALD